MVRQDIVGGLKNAIARGIPLEKAKQSFINSGYNRGEVEEAVNFLLQGAISLSNQQPRINPQLQPTQPQQKPQPIQQYQPPQITQPMPQIPPQIPQQYPTQPQRGSNGTVIMLLIFLILLLIAIGVVAFLFKDDLTKLIMELF